MTNLNKILYDEFDKMGIFTTCLDKYDKYKRKYNNQYQMQVIIVL